MKWWRYQQWLLPRAFDSESFDAGRSVRSVFCYLTHVFFLCAFSFPLRSASMRSLVLGGRVAFCGATAVAALLLLLLASSALHPASASASSSSSASQVITVHLVPHSHEDAGYEKTIDEYFYGTNQSIRASGVQYRMDTIVPTLEVDTGRRFIQVEIAFFHPWWLEQDDSMHERVKKLVASGQLELAFWWVMHDRRRLVQLQSIQINQMILEHKNSSSTHSVAVTREEFHAQAGRSILSVTPLLVPV